MLKNKFVYGAYNGPELYALELNTSTSWIKKRMGTNILSQSFALRLSVFALLTLGIAMLLVTRTYRLVVYEAKVLPIE